MIKKVAFFGHRVRDMARAKRFYGERLGLEKAADYEGNGLMLHQIALERAKS